MAELRHDKPEDAPYFTGPGVQGASDAAHAAAHKHAVAYCRRILDDLDLGANLTAWGQLIRAAQGGYTQRQQQLEQAEHRALLLAQRQMAEAIDG